MGPGKVALSVHLKAQKSADLLWRVNLMLRRMGVSVSTVQIEEEIAYENEIVCD